MGLELCGFVVFVGCGVVEDVLFFCVEDELVCGEVVGGVFCCYIVEVDKGYEVVFVC